LSEPRFTFAVVGHNEAPTLGVLLEQAREAARPGDRVWFVDSASTDGSAEIAAALGAEVIDAPLGKGRAMSRALELCGEGYICFGDADISWSSVNIMLALRERTLVHRPEMLVGSATQTTRTRLSVTPAIYEPLVGALFPGALGQFAAGLFALSGLRAIDASVPLGDLPARYGAETHLNLLFWLERRRMTVEDLGLITNSVRGYANVPAIAEDVAAAVLDSAERHRRLDPALRSKWEAWTSAVLDVIRAQPPEGAPDDDYVARLRTVAARPLPPARRPA
jgi:glycosyltransferase involved in cell wall biosynthesis